MHKDISFFFAVKLCCY